MTEARGVPVTADPAAVLTGLIEEATPGEWFTDDDGWITSNAARYAIADTGSGTTGDADAALIVHLVNLAPKVVDLITAAEKVVAARVKVAEASEGPILDNTGWPEYGAAMAELNGAIDLKLIVALGALTVTPAGEGPAPT